MKKYKITYKGKERSVSVLVEYDKGGLLHSVAFDDSEYRATEIQRQWLLERVPTSTANLANMGHTVIVEEIEDATFDRFWDLYGVKRNKFRAEKMWDKMTLAEREKAMGCIQAYKRYTTRKGIEMKYPDTFLVNKGWLDSYK